MSKKLFITLAMLGLAVGIAQPSSAAIWQSQSGKTILPNLDSICWGSSQLDGIQTTFGGGTYRGSLSFDYVKTQGCLPGDTLRGGFNLYTSNHHCSGTVTVNWQANNNAYLQWDITNAGVSTSCPVGLTTRWEINTYPVAQQLGESPPAATSLIGTAVVFNPPSNVRATLNGTIICSVKTVSTINIYSSMNGWYLTDICGTTGYIHHSQIRF